jgi:hypothetical protein
MERTCKKCGETKPIEEFIKRKDRPIGYFAQCRKCNNKRNKSRRDLDADKAREKERLWYKKHYTETHQDLIKEQEYKKELLNKGLNICIKCKEIKPVNEFRKDRNTCKLCRKIQLSEYRISNKEYIKNRLHSNYIKNREKQLRQSKLYYRLHRDGILLLNKIYRESHKAEQSILGKEWRGSHKEHISKYRELNKTRINNNRRRYSGLNKDKIKKWGRNNYNKHKDKIREKNEEWKRTHVEQYNRYIKLRSRKQVDGLIDNYIIQIIVRNYKISQDIVKQHPELIENWRQQIKIKRLLKQKKHEDIKAS